MILRNLPRASYAFQLENGLWPFTSLKISRIIEQSPLTINQINPKFRFIGLNSSSDLLVHPKLGASWEGFALEEIIRFEEADQGECYFWATHQNAELDLLIIKDGKRSGFEFKYANSPKLTKSMQIAMEDLKLRYLTVIYPGEIDYPLADHIQVVGLKNYLLKN